MFSGIIEKVGVVKKVQERAQGLALQVHMPSPSRRLRLGDSVAVNGCCLTLTRLGKGSFWVFVSHETLAKTNLKFLKPGDRVNLEPAITLQSSLDGHMVQGHVETLAPLSARKQRGESLEIKISLPKSLAPLVIEKGSIAIDGVSLTVNTVRDVKSAVEVGINLIPYTQNATTLSEKKVGDLLNIETDLLGRYVLRNLKLRARRARGS